MYTCQCYKQCFNNNYYNNNIKITTITTLIKHINKKVSCFWKTNLKLSRKLKTATREKLGYNSIKIHKAVNIIFAKKK